MRVDRRVAWLCALTTLMGQYGCAASTAPRGWLPYAQEAQQEGYGGWIQVTTRAQSSTSSLSGELLAVSEDSVLVLTSAGVGGRALPDVVHATLEGYDSRTGATSQMVLAGTLLSITTGFGLIFFVPLWVVVGSISTAALSHQGQVNMDASHPATGTPMHDTAVRSWHDMRLFARFPQGVPAGVDRSQLRMRQLVERTERTKTMGRRDIVQ